jgi:SAM-dependent methyltransferase
MIPSLMKLGVVPNNSFDVGVMFHTLDHLPDPVSTLKDAIQALKPGGVFLVAVHNEKSWSARLLGEKSPIIDVEHTHLYTKKTGRMLFEKAGFVNVKAGSYWNHYLLAYLIHLIPISRTLRKKILFSPLGKLMSKIKNGSSFGKYL